MEDMILSTNILPDPLFGLIRSEKFRVREMDGEIRLIPIEGSAHIIERLRGSLSAYPEMSVDNFLKRKRADKERET